MVYTREQHLLFSLKIQELILFYTDSIFSLFSLKVQALILYYVQESILPLFSLNVKYGLTTI